MGLNGRERNTVHRTCILHPINWDWPAALGQVGGEWDSGGPERTWVPGTSTAAAEEIRERDTDTSTHLPQRGFAAVSHYSGTPEL